MVKLNRRQEEMEALRALDDKRVNEELYSTYRSIIKDIQAKVADHLEDVGDQPYWKQQQTKALAHLHDEMVDIIREKYPEVKETISKYKEDQLVKGYNGSFYDMEGQAGGELDFPMVNKEFLEASVKAPVAGKRLSERLYRNRERMAKQAQTAVTAGIIQGHSYKKIARQIAGVGEADYRKALRIARTEAGRMHSIGKAKAMDEAKEMGIDVMKQWVSTLDRRTRHTHQFLDGQIVTVDDNFKNASGMEAKMPCMFGQPSEDCNCRCTAVTIVDGIKPTARLDNETGEIIENMTYQEWEEKTMDRHLAGTRKKSLINNLNKRYNIDKKALGNLSNKELENIKGSIESSLKDFPEVKKYLKKVTITDKMDEGTTASASFRFRDGKPQFSMKLNKNHVRDPKGIAKQADVMYSMGQWSKKDGLKGVIDHEATHLQEAIETVKRHGNLTGKNTPQEMKGVRYAYAHGELAQEVKEKALEALKISEESGTIESQLGTYATKNASEFIAEAYSDDSNSQIANEVRRIIKKEWGK